MTEKQAALQADDGEKPKAHDPLTRTGPAAVTEATIAWLQKQVGLRWNALTGLKDGGRSKLASDVLVLPITGFRYVLSAFYCFLFICFDASNADS